jgi:hypothetical protein
LLTPRKDQRVLRVQSRHHVVPVGDDLESRVEDFRGADEQRRLDVVEVFADSVGDVRKGEGLLVVVVSSDSKS